VNAQFGSKPSSKFAFKLDSSQFVQKGNLDQQMARTMFKITEDLNNRLGYDRAVNEGKEEPTFSKGKVQAIEDLKGYFKGVAEGPCT